MSGALSDERTGLPLKLLVDLASAVILGSDSRGTRDHILLSQIRDFPFRRLLRLARQRWRYSTPPPHDEDRQISGNCSREINVEYRSVQIRKTHVLKQEFGV
jgi:hypothetical protein